MATTNCRNQHRNTNIASLLNDHHHRSSHHHHRIFTSYFRRKFLQLIACGSASHHQQNDNLNSIQTEQTETEHSDSISNSNPPGSGKLSDLLLNISSSSSFSSSSSSSSSECSDAVKRRKVEALEEMKGVVRRLTEAKEFEEASKAASDVRRLSKDDPFARETLAMLGAIPPLIELLDRRVDCVDQAAAAAPLYALLNLAIRNDLNKAAIVEAGAVHKMLHLIEFASGSPGELVSEAIVANFLGLSALDSNKVLIGSSGAIPFLVKIAMDNGVRNGSQIKKDALTALYNLSIQHLNVGIILETNLVRYFVNALGDMDVSERILSILSNVVSTAEGRKAVSLVPDAFPILVDVLNWNDSPGCQEKVLYVLMAIAHKMNGGRRAMVEAGAMSALLELTLVGSTLAQKRASRILEFLDKGKRLSERCNGGLTTTLSAPICGTSSTVTSLRWDHKESLEDEQAMMSEEKKAVNKLVQQSLQSNMIRIAQRANLPQDFVPSDHFKTLTLSSTSKSLPF